MSYLGIPPFGQTVRTVTTQTANGSANTFYPTGGYTVGYLDVFYNGVRVVEAVDYTAGDGNSVTFSAAPTSNAVIEMVSYGPISFVDSLARSGDTMGGTFYVRDLIPAANNTYSLGNSSYRFANLYLSGNTITIGDSTISANATSVTFANSTGGAAEVMLPNTGVVADTYGHSTGIPVVTVDRMGRVSNVTIANTQSHYDTAYSNAVSVANTTSFNQAANAYANAVSDATNLAANAYANAISYASDKAANAYANAISYASDKAANAYANVFNGGTFTGVTTFTANVTGNSAVFNGNLQVDGSFTVSGGNVLLNAITMTTEDNMLYMNEGRTANVTNVVGNGSVVIFTANNAFANGWDVYVSGVSPNSYNGTYLNLLEANATHFQVSNTNTASYVSGGAARAKAETNPDIGISAGYNDGSYHHTGVFRDATDGVWKFFHNYTPEPDDSVYINTSHATFALANVQANTFVGDLTGSANSATYLGGNTALTLRTYSSDLAANAYANATSYAATIAGTAYSNATSFASNASNITTGTLSNSRLSGVHTVSSDPNSSGPGTMAIGSNSSVVWIQSHGGLPLVFNPVGNSIRAANIYDNNDTGYYVDPASTSKFSTLQLGTGISMSANNTTARNMWFRGNGSSDVGISFYSDSGWCAQFYANYNDGYGFLNGNWAGWDLKKVPSGNFYMNDNTTYYLKTNAHSYVYSLRAASYLASSGNIYTDADYGYGLVGLYASTRYQGVFAMGDAYKLPADGTTTGSLYGIAWSHGNAGGAASNLASHGMLILENGTFKGAWGGGSLRTPGDVRGTLFYDWDNTGYYLDPNSTSQLSYVLANNWFRSQGYTGLYSQDYGCHWYPNNTSSHGAWQVSGYNKGSYCGLAVQYNYWNNLMYDSDGNGGVYQENGQGWHFYFHRGNDCMGISGSSTASGYAIRPNGNQYTDGYIYASAYYYTSDERKKENIITIPNALEKVLQLRGVNFNWKDNAKVVAGRRSGGLIAQEVKPIIPEAVFVDVNDNDIKDALGLDTTPIVGYLIEAVKEQQNMINKLKEEIELLKGN